MSVSDNQLRIALLGKPKFERNGQPLLGLTSLKGQALLAYLAVTRQPHSRSALAGLLWSDMPEDMARTNLRVTLSLLHKAVGDVVITARRTVEFNRRSDTWLDVEELENAASSGTKLALAAELYRGDFLDNLYVPEAELFEDWVLSERERFRQLALEVLGQLAGRLLAQGQFADGIEAARRLLSIEPWHEAGHRQLMKLLAADGQRSAALAQYETCRQILADELGVEPMPETTQLYERLKTAGTPPPHNLPPPPNSFVGREAELQQIAAQLANPNCRLLTIVGPGGIGKTRLVLEGARRYLKPETIADEASFADGIFFVSLAPISAGPDLSDIAQRLTGLSNSLVSPIADAVDFSFHGATDLMGQLLNYLRTKELLLVLDNFEHLISPPPPFPQRGTEERSFPEVEPGLSLLVNIVQHAPQVKLLISSRERLKLQEEWVLELEGLEYPSRGAGEAEQSLSSTFQTYSAIALFLQRAQQMGTGFALSAADEAQVVRICQLVEGMPLGLELAASWLHTLSCAEIATEIKRSLDFLAAPLRNLPARHRSLRAVFDHSWAMLTESEQAVLCKLSIFRGGFLREAAAKVAGASLFMLAQFVDKSLLRRTATGRYDMHELLRQYVAEKLWTTESDLAGAEQRPEMAPLVWQRHSNYYLNFISQREAALRGNAPQQTVAEIRTEVDNIRQAWRWAVTEGKVAELEPAIGALSRFYDLTGQFQGGELVFGRAAHYLADYFAGEDQSSDKRVQQVIVRLWVEQARLLNRRGLSTQALQIMPQAAELAHQIQNTYLEAITYHQWGETLSFHGEPQASQAQLEKALRLARAAGLLAIEAEILRHLGIARKDQGDYTDASKLFQRSLICFRQLGDRRGEGLVLNNLGILARRQGQYAQAQTNYEQALNGFFEIGDLWGQDVVLNNLGNLMYDRGNYTEAQALCHQGLQLCRKIRDSWGETHLLNTLGNIMREQGDFIEAQRCYEQCLQLRREIGAQLDQGTTLADLALLYHLSGDNEAARAYSLEAEQIGQKLGSPNIRAQALTCLGHAQVALGLLEEAAEAYQQAIALYHKLGEPHRALESLAGLTRSYLAQGNLPQAQAHAEEIIPHLETDGLDGTAEPFRIFLTCYRVLQAGQDSRARSVLETAYRLLHARAARIEDEARRRSFLFNIAIHRELEQEFRTL